MNFKFKTQKYQLDAVDAVCNVFKGQTYYSSVAYTIDTGLNGQVTQPTLFDNEDEDDIGYSNHDINIDESSILTNIQTIQSKSNLPVSSVLKNDMGILSLDIEMETGTGKTYTYTRTIFELNKIYGWSKFIIVVPSIAIREGVKKSLEQTETHFMSEYGKKIRFFIYNSKNLGQIDEFSKDSSIHVMIINIQAFNTKNADSRRIYDVLDEFQSRKPIDVLAKNKPILILDEPQKMSGKNTKDALLNFNPLFIINYSATHKEYHNLVYVLDALDAYNQKLVKKIEVKGFQVKNLRGTNSYLYLQRIVVDPKNPPKALIELEINYNKSINRETRYFSVGDNLYVASKNMEQYKDFVISEIDPLKNTITFLNGESLTIGESSGDISENDIRRIQIRETIISHLDKEEELFKKGIKVLSLFFIDEVSKYREYDEDGNQLLGLYGRIFEEEYKNEVNKRINIFDDNYQKYLTSIDVEKTHNGYFSIDKKGRAIDSKLKRNSDESDDVSAYDLILKDKEKLLSFSEPTRFIFSHSALREGWDNPNVFQICTLKHSTSDVQRHQEVGRGLRICVNKDGDRMDSTVQGANFHDINTLTVIANEAYESFVKGLQTQIKENLFDRPTKITQGYFADKSIEDNNGNIFKLDSKNSNDILYYLIKSNYIDSDGNITDDYKNDKNNNSLKPLPACLEQLSNGIHILIQQVYDNSVGIIIGNGNKSRITNISLNSNFSKKEFQELWDTINHKYAYTVNFDTNELIDKAVNSINNNLNVTSLLYTVSTGSQKDVITKDDIDASISFNTSKSKTQSIQSFANQTLKYDLLGKIRENTKLTRKTISEILLNIDDEKFYMYKTNPEEFIKKVSNLINEQKATLIVEHVTYNQTSEPSFDSTIFTEEINKINILKAFKSKKGVLDYINGDSITERKFAESLDVADEVVVYAKLPKGFYIPTPVGNYTPDWAIAFKENSVKHVFFIAETKGTLSSMQLRKIEEAKIKCATKLFDNLSTSKIKYDQVKDYKSLLDIIKF